MFRPGDDLKVSIDGMEEPFIVTNATFDRTGVTLNLRRKNDCEFVGIPLHLDNEKMTKSDRDLIVELSRTVAKLNRRIDALEERAEMNEEDIEKWGRRTVEADYKAGQALINTKLTKEGVDRE